MSKDNFVKIFGSYFSSENYIFLLFFALVTIIASCECVTKLDTPKIISPENYSEVLIINSLADRETLAVESDNIELLYKSPYQVTYPEYQKVNAGESYLRLSDPKTSLYLINMPIELSKKSNYTLVFYGLHNSVKALIILDSLNKIKNSGNSYYRFIHTSIDAGNLSFGVKSQNQKVFELGFRSFTYLNELQPGNYDIEIVNPDNNKVVYSINSFNIKSGKLYSFVLKGTAFTLPTKPLFLEIIETNV